ncbi:MAG: NAD(+) diphosphatase [Polyangiaceae bacterium]|nr:NAD(+) diphosphatase [Polyangiaceae bacterium]
MIDPASFESAFLPTVPDDEAFWFPFRGPQLLLKSTGGKGASPLRRDEFLSLGLEVIRAQYIGALNGVGCVAAELQKDAPEVTGHQYLDLRRAFFALDPSEFAAAGLAFQIQYWDKNHRFCGGCGGPLALKQTERAKRCDPCDRDFYPPVVPAMIVRVVRGDHILMTRQSRFPKGMYGLVAGFLEPGETLEECVAREVLEETGVRVHNVRYFGSQPWPFPHQIMIGFVADYLSGDIVVDTSELEEAAWFNRSEMPMLPPPISLARRLIDDFLNAD